MHIPFTELLLVWACFAYAANAGAVVKCLFWGVCVSFSCTPLFDATAFARLRAARGFSLALFWWGHVVLHVVPLALLAHQPVRYVDGVLAAMLHLGWAYRVSDGTLCLDEVYAPLPDGAWRSLMVIAVTTELCVALV